MKSAYRIIASLTVFTILITHSVFAIGLTRNDLFSGVTYSSNDTIDKNPGSLWRSAINGDRIPAYTSTRFLSNSGNKTSSTMIFRSPGKHQVYSTEMLVS
jgi:hypothetical protein